MLRYLFSFSAEVSLEGLRLHVGNVTIKTTSPVTEVHHSLKDLYSIQAEATWNSIFSSGNSVGLEVVAEVSPSLRPLFR